MKIARMISPVHSLGPGERVCLWTQGCTKHCEGCISPELQPFTGAEADETLIAGILVRTAQANGCTGLTISGGDPFEQPKALLRLLQAVRPAFDDILVYTGYELAEIRSGCSGPEGNSALSLIDVLIDGRYIERLNRPDCVLRGSANQTVHYFNAALENRYLQYMKQGRILENFSHQDSVITTGIPDRRIPS